MRYFIPCIITIHKQVDSDFCTSAFEHLQGQPPWDPYTTLSNHISYRHCSLYLDMLDFYPTQVITCNAASMCPSLDNVRCDDNKNTLVIMSILSSSVIHLRMPIMDLKCKAAASPNSELILLWIISHCKDIFCLLGNLYLPLSSAAEWVSYFITASWTYFMECIIHAQTPLYNLF